MKERLDEILRIALKYDVTDIHFSFSRREQKLRIEMRMEGKMFRLKEKEEDLRLFRYLMYKANLDVSDVMAPQTGRFEEIVDSSCLSLRFAVVSGWQMISGVLRILNNHESLEISQLCDDPDTEEWLAGITDHRSGLYVFSGPTGSGKTTSLYTILNACRGKKIYTLEDPVEVINKGYVQLQINERSGFSYAEGIRQLMRHDPDIIMIGEIRDSTAARMAVRSALTGHLVLTSLHSSGCVSALHRLIDLGVEQYQLEDVLTGISCQRLFELPDGRRTGIYEFMNRREVKDYFANGKVSDSFRDLQERIREAVGKGLITAEQAKADLAG